MRLAAIATLVLLVACTTPPPPVTPRNVMPVNASAAKTWDAVIDIFAERNIPIRNMERASGFISTDALAVNQRQGLQWANCGKAVGVPIGPDRATYNVLVREDGQGSTVKATVRWTEGGHVKYDALVECTTTGSWEAETERQIKARAEK